MHTVNCINFHTYPLLKMTSLFRLLFAVLHATVVRINTAFGPALVL